jgi:hypothetical protein
VTGCAGRSGDGEDGGGKLASSCMVLLIVRASSRERFLMVGTAKEQPYRACEDSGGDITSPRMLQLLVALVVDIGIDIFAVGPHSWAASFSLGLVFAAGVGLVAISAG